jgi:hypothetical protein
MDPYPIHLFDYNTKQKGAKRLKNISTNVGRFLFCKITFNFSSNFFFFNLKKSLILVKDFYTW